MKLPGIPGVAFLTGLFFLSIISGKAQSAADDSIVYKKALYHTIAVYHQAIGDQSGLFNGSQYAKYPYSFAAGGHPFFFTDKPSVGSVVYDDILYENVNLQFDEVQEVLFMQDSTRRIQLLNPRIGGFTVFGNTFIPLVKDSVNSMLIASGFYNILYNGNVSLLKKEEKTIKEDVATGELLRYIESRSWYYIRRNNTYYPIKNKNSIADIFEDHKKDVRQYIRKNKLSYRKDRDNMLTKVTAYYDQLIK